jgi:Zn-dependent protease with chaperone function
MAFFGIVPAVGFAGLVAWIGYLFLIRHNDRIETYETQIPLVLGTLAAFLYGVFSALVGVLFFIKGYGPPLQGVFLAGGGVFCFPVAAAILSRKTTLFHFRRKLHWRVLRVDSINEAIRNAAQDLALPCIPTVAFSDRINLPRVLGRSHRNAILILPDGWMKDSEKNLQDSSIRFQLYHELAHLKNRDVGFTTWAYTFMRVLFPCWVLSSLFLSGTGFDTDRYSQAIGLIPILMMTQGLVLSFLYFAVLRHREQDADALAIHALGEEGLWGLNRLREENVPWRLDKGNKDKNSRAPSWRLRMDLRLSDRMIFGRFRPGWRFLHRIFTYMFRSHPSFLERISRVQVKRSDTGWRIPSMDWAIWTGLVIGLFIQSGVLGFGVLSLVVENLTGISGGNVFSQNLFPFWLIVGLPLAGLAAALVALMPCRFSDEASPLQFSYVKRLAGWMGVAAVSAGVIHLPLFSLWWNLTSMTLGAIGLAFIITLAAGLFSSNRYILSSSNLQDALISSVYHLPVLLLFLSGGIIVFIVFQSFTATGLYLAGILLGGLFLGRLDGKVSWRDGYVKGRLLGKHILIERPEFDRWSWFQVCLIEGVGFFLPAFFTAGIFLTIFAFLPFNLHWNAPASCDTPLAIALLLASVTIAAVKMRFRMPEKISAPLLDSLATHITILKEFFPERLQGWQEPLKKVTDDLKTIPYGYTLGRIDLTELDKRIQLCRCLAAAYDADMVKRSICEWLLPYECPDGGFGLWANSRPRLLQTFEVLTLLEEDSMLGEVDGDKHGRFLQACQREDGRFDDNPTRYPIEMKTYWGWRALKYLHQRPRYPLSSEMTNRLEGSLRKAILRSQPEAVYTLTWLLKETNHLSRLQEEEIIIWAERYFHLLFQKRTRRVVREYLFLLRLMKLCPGITEKMKSNLSILSEQLNESMGSLFRQMQSG